MTAEKREPLTTGQIAKYCHVSHRGVLKWVETGKLKAYRTPGKHSRVQVEDFINFLKEYHMPVPHELQPASSFKRVLIVDDDRGIVHSLRRVLMMDNKFQIETAFDGFEAGKKFSSFQPELVILDIHMPTMDGFQVYANIRNDAAHPHAKVLIISGVNDPKEMERVRNLGADGFLQKPFSNEVLKEHMERMLG